MSAALLPAEGDPAALLAAIEAAWADGRLAAPVAAAERASLAAALDGLEPHGFGPALVVGSGGSSGGRRWCLQPLAHLEASAAATGAWLRQQGIEPASCLHLNPLPLRHVSGLMPWLRARCWQADHRVLTPELLRCAEALAAEPLPDDRPALLSLVPTQLRRLLDSPPAVAWLRRCRLIWVGGAPLGAELAQRARQLELPLAPCYGSTETAAMVAALAPERFLAGVPGCGQPLSDCRLRLAADGAVEVATERLSPGCLQGGRLKPLPVAGGWWRSGDAGRLDADGLLVLGRLDGALHSGGVTVFPEQIEQRLRADAAATGVPLAEVLLLAEPDPLWGERLVALVRPEGDADPAWLVERLEALARRFPAAERPRAWILCPTLAPTALGKWERSRWGCWLGESAFRAER